MPTTRPLRVLGVLADEPRGIDWWRLLVPFRHLPRHDCQVIACPAREFDNRYLQWADVIVSATLFPTESLEQLRAYCTKRRKVIVKDLDDDVWSIPDSNPFAREAENHEYGWKGVRASIPAIEASIEAADLVTTTTEVLAGRLRERFPGKCVVVLPNCIDPEDWPDKQPHEGIVVGTCGGESHVEDYRILATVYPELHRRFPAVTLLACGYLPNYLGDLGYVAHAPSVPLAEYPALVGRLDVRLCPLEATTFNQSKSPIALIEACAAGAVPVVSPTVYGDFIGRVRGGRGDRTPLDWQIRIEQWLDAGAAGLQRNTDHNRRWVREEYNIETQAHRWANAYRAAWLKVQ